MLMKAPNLRRVQQGFSLIETLVAMLLLSIGMLAMVWMQAKGAEYERTAEFRNSAMQKAVEYADRIRANVGASASYVHMQPYRPGSRIADAAKNCRTESCSPAEMAAFDVVEMRRMIRNSLPGGDVFVQQLANDRMNIWVVWQQPAQQVLDENRLSFSSLCPASGLNPEQGVIPHCMPFGVFL